MTAKRSNLSMYSNNSVHRKVSPIITMIRMRLKMRNALKKF